jgi:hypothetical protein
VSLFPRVELKLTAFQECIRVHIFSSQPLNELRTPHRIDDVPKSIAVVDSMLYERNENLKFLVDRIEERANMPLLLRHGPAQVPDFSVSAHGMHIPKIVHDCNDT